MTLCGLCIALLATCGQACADDEVSSDAADVAERLMANTVTVRSMADVPRAIQDPAPTSPAVTPYNPPAQGEGAPVPAGADLSRTLVTVTPQMAQAMSNVAEVSVSSGVALEGGTIVTVIDSRLPTRLRITLPDGSQAEAEPRVIDHYTGLCLLQIDPATLPGLALREGVPRVGETVLTAAASGTEGALVSQGVLSAVDRLVDSQLPPLLQSDVRTTETSHGAGLVDREGRLIGMLVTTEAGEERSGWAYAVPVWHVSRLVRAIRPGELVTLEQQRPMLGLVLSNNRDQAGVRIVEALAGSPAAAAGLQADDLLKSVGDVAVRHPYQVQAQVLKRVPGESLSIAFERDGEPQEAEVTLSSDSRVQQQSGQATDEDLEYQQDVNQAPANSRFGPQLKVQLVAPNQLEIRNSGRASNALPRQSAIGQEAPRPTDEGAVDGKILQLEQSVEILQAEVKRRSQAERELLKQILTLTEEVARLRQVPAAQPAKGK